MRGRHILLAAGAGAALAMSWVLPRVEAPVDRFSIAMSLIADGRASDAVHLLDDQTWRGIAEFRANRYRRAATEFVQADSVVALYNLGTTYARLAEWDGARAALEKVLRLDPSHEDAAHNLSLVLKAQALQQQEQKEQSQTRSLGTEKGADGKGDQQETAPGDKATTDAALPSDDAAPSQQDASRAGQIAQQGRTGDQARTQDAAAGRGAVTESDDQEAAGQTGAGAVRILTKSAQNIEVLLRGIKDDPERVLAARLRAIDRIRRENAQ